MLIALTLPGLFKGAFMAPQASAEPDQQGDVLTNAFDALPQLADTDL